LAGIFSLNIPTNSPTWFDVLRQNRNATNDFGRLQYQSTTNLWRFARDLNVQVGNTFAGPANVMQPFEAAMEFSRAASGGYFDVWFDGVQATSQSGLNTGTFVSPLLVPTIALPANVGASGGIMTASNWLAWIPETRPYPGKRIMRRMEPIADGASQQWVPTARPHFTAMADAGWNVTAVGGTGTNAAMRNSFLLSDLAVEPQVLEALFFHGRATVGSFTPGISQPGGEQTLPAVPTGGGRGSFPTSFGGVPWNSSLANSVELFLEAVSAGTQSSFAHLVAVCSVANQLPPEPPTGGAGRAFIISSGS
jgi:hypothetical protein